MVEEKISIFNYTASEIMFISMKYLEETLVENVDRRVLRWFGHAERMDEGN